MKKVNSRSWRWKSDADSLDIVFYHRNIENFIFKMHYYKIIIRMTI